MLNKILTKLGLRMGLGDASHNQDIDTRRKHMRHDGFHAEVLVQDRSYGIRDWSLGGVCFETHPDPRLVVGDKLQVTLRFRLPHETVLIRQTGRVVRAAKRGIAAEFPPLAPEVRRAFERVIDGLHARKFLESQVA